MSFKKKYHLQDILDMDRYLLQLASYESSKGMIRTPKDIEGVLNLSNDISKMFNYFKRLIQNGECTFEELEQMVITRHGAIPNPDHNLSMNDALEKLLSEPDKPEELPDPSIDFMNLLMDSLEKVCPDGTILIGPVESSSLDVVDQESLTPSIEETEVEENVEDTETTNEENANGNKSKKNRESSTDN